MSEVSIKALAEEIGTPIDRLLQQFADAGISKKAEDSVNQQEKESLLSHLKKEHGGNTDEAPTRLTLQRKTRSTLSVSGTGGKSKNIQVEVRKKRTYVKRSALEEEQRAEDARKAEEDAKRAAEEAAKREAEERAKREAEEKAQREAEAKRLAEEKAQQSEKQANRDAVDTNPRQAEEKAKRAAEQQAKKEAEELQRRREEEAKRKAEEDSQRQLEEARKMAEINEKNWSKRTRKQVLWNNQTTTRLPPPMPVRRKMNKTAARKNLAAVLRRKKLPAVLRVMSRVSVRCLSVAAVTSVVVANSK